MAADARRLLRDRTDPLAARAAARAPATGPTFREVAEELMADKASGWRNTKHRAQWASTLVACAYPAFGDRPVQDVDDEAVMQVLIPTCGSFDSWGTQVWFFLIL